MNRITKIGSLWLLLLVGLFTFRAVAQETHATTGTHIATTPADSALASQLLMAEAAKSGDVDVSGMILGHVGDAYEWHFITVGDTHVSLSLPIIVKSDTRGWYCFSSAHFHHGHQSHEGFYIAAVGDHQGKVVEIDPVSGQEVRPLDISITKNALGLMLNALLLISLVLYCSHWYKNRKPQDTAPRGLVGAIEMLFSMIYDEVIKTNIPQHVQRYAPYLLTAFFFIFFNNLIGLIPGSANLTGNIAITFVLATCTFLLVNGFGNKAYWKEILLPDVPGWLMPIMAIIEIIGIFTKPVALMIRLFANIFAGHTALLALFSIIFITASMGAAMAVPMTVLSIAFGLFMDCLELLVAFIQAYVFTMLSAVFIGMSQPMHRVEKASH